VQQVCLQPHTSAVNITLLAFAADRCASAPLLLSTPAAETWRRRPLLSIIISCLHSAQQQTHRLLLLLLSDGTDRWMDVRLLDRFIDPAPHTMLSLSIVPLKLRPYGAMQICLLLLLFFLAHQHKACRQLKIKQEMTAVGD